MKKQKNGWTGTDIKFMRLALELAEKGKGKTSPNPMVGAVVVKNGKVVGSGYHKKAGTPHAEVLALKNAGENANGATLYVTLEPCNTYGRTPPCAPAIVEAGIRRVIIAADDMNPANRNNGVRYLRKHGIKAEQGLLRFEADELNRAYNKFISTGMPFVTIKAAISLDGKIATKTGNSKWISSSQSRNLVKKMRREVDAVLVGRNTYLKDKPRFKGVKNKIYLGKQRANLKILMRDLAKKNIMHVLIEGGGETIASALEAGIADRICVFIAPIIIGGRNAPTLVEGEGIKYISNALDIKNVNLKSVGRDYMVTGCLRE